MTFIFWILKGLIIEQPTGPEKKTKTNHSAYCIKGTHHSSTEKNPHFNSGDKWF